MIPAFVERAAAWAGVELSDHQQGQLARFAEWIIREAIPAGGVGPNEAEAVSSRHIADSLCFAAGWRGWETPPAAIADLGSGAGLPAIPLAITHPGTIVYAVDRAGRRCQLTKRAARVTGVDNVETVQADIERWDTVCDVVVSRAALEPQALLPHLRRLTRRVAVVGGSHERRPEQSGYETIEVPVEILENRAWLLMMTPP